MPYGLGVNLLVENWEGKEIIKVEGLSKEYPILGGLIHRPIGYLSAVKKLSFHIDKGETLGLVGESGCGKTTLASMVLGMIKPSEGTVYFKGQDINKMKEKQLHKIRKNIQMIFQDPYSSLSQRLTVEEIIIEPIMIQKLCSKKEAIEKVPHYLDLVGLDKSDGKRYASDFSGGQRQRIGIARALVLQPEFIVCDEPVSALDVSIHAQIINLLKSIQKEFGLTYLFISHNLGIVRHVSTRTAVMYLGVFCELADSEELFENPMHPYTRALISAIPTLDINNKKNQVILNGDVPSPINPPSGCRFRTRCPECRGLCGEKEPELKEVGPGHFVACHFC